MITKMINGGIMKKIICICIIIIILTVCIIAFLIYNGNIKFNNPSSEDYPVRGIDVSEYQGEIDWEKLSSQNIDFAYIKATEGSSYTDERFQYNYQNAITTNLKIGAYHFFSFDSDAISQSENYIKNVPKDMNLLPPVVDIEFYGDKNKNIPDVETTREQLKKLLERLEEYYQKKPIIYATNTSYNLYIKDNFEEYKIWIRDIFSTPNLKDNRKWTLWQYTNRERLEGYNGEEKFIDMNVFNGNYEEFMKLVEE